MLIYPHSWLLLLPGVHLKTYFCSLNANKLNYPKRYFLLVNQNKNNSALVICDVNLSFITVGDGFGPLHVVVRSSLFTPGTVLKGSRSTKLKKVLESTKIHEKL